MFSPASQLRPFLRLALCGPSGSGKTRGALALASGMGKRIAVLDTEPLGAALYAADFGFDLARITPPYAPECLARGVREAGERGYDVLVVDCLSRPWNGPGGVLDMVAENRSLGMRQPWAAPGEAHEDMLLALREAPCHVISTLRVNAPHGSWRDGAEGIPCPEQRRDILHEFLTVARMLPEGRSMQVSKDVTGVFMGLSDEHGRMPSPCAEHGHRLLRWHQGVTVGGGIMGRALKNLGASRDPEELARRWAWWEARGNKQSPSLLRDSLRHAVADRLLELAPRAR